MPLGDRPNRLFSGFLNCLCVCFFFWKSLCVWFPDSTSEYDSKSSPAGASSQRTHLACRLAPASCPGAQSLTRPSGPRGSGNRRSTGEGKSHGRDGALHPFQQLLSTSGSSDAPRWSEHLLWVCCSLLLWRNVLLLHLAVVNFAFCRGLEDCLVLNLLFHVVVIGAIYHWHSANSGPLAENTPLTPVSFRLMDRAARSPFHKKRGTSGSTRAPMPRGVCDGLRLPCGAALAHWPLLESNRMGAHTAMCAGGVLVLLSISLLLLLLTPATEDVELFMRLCVCVSLWLPILGVQWMWWRYWLWSRVCPFGTPVR